MDLCEVIKKNVGEIDLGRLLKKAYTEEYITLEAFGGVEEENKEDFDYLNSLKERVKPPDEFKIQEDALKEFSDFLADKIDVYLRMIILEFLYSPDNALSKDHIRGGTNMDFKEIPEYIIRGSVGLIVDPSSCKALARILEKQGARIAVEAGKLCKHSGRDLIRDVHIKMASERLGKSELMNVDDLRQIIGEELKKTMRDYNYEGRRS